MRNEWYIQLAVDAAQVALANALVDYSIAHHPVQDIFAHDPGGKERQRDFRFTGTLGEIVFADAYGLPRPTRSFGAVDGQDFGQDFAVGVGEKQMIFDIKSMRRKNNRFYENYVLNIPAYQLQRNALTEAYFCISLHEETPQQYIASLLGYVRKADIVAGKVGIRYAKGATRTKDDGDTFVFQRDTYEIDFGDITSPPQTDAMAANPRFQRLELKQWLRRPPTA